MSNPNTGEISPTQAAFLMVGSLFLLGLQDSLVKFLSSDISLWQFQLLRAICNLALLGLLWRLVWRSWDPRPKRMWAVALRSMLLVCAMMSFFSAMPFLTLSELAAGLYLFPIFILILSAILFGEKLEFIRVTAVLMSFVGAFFILQPNSASFQWVSLFPILSALFYALTILATRKLCRNESAKTLAMSSSIGFAVVGCFGIGVMEFTQPSDAATGWPYLFTGWNSLSTFVVSVVVLCSILNLSANIGLSKAYQSADSTWLAPFDYAYIAFATFWGFVLWNEVPDQFIIFGVILIAGSGLSVIWKERLESKSEKIFSTSATR